MKHILLLTCFAFLTACGFTPMLSQTEDTINTSGARLIVTNASKDGSSYLTHQLRQRLKYSLKNLNFDKHYKIHIQVFEDSGSISYATDATANRSMLKLSAQLTITKDSQTIYATKLNALTSYSQNANDEFANQSAQNGAKERLLEVLNIDISRELQRFSKEEYSLN